MKFTKDHDAGPSSPKPDNFPSLNRELRRTCRSMTTSRHARVVERQICLLLKRPSRIGLAHFPWPERRHDVRFLCEMIEPFTFSEVACFRGQCRSRREFVPNSIAINAKNEYGKQAPKLAKLLQKRYHYDASRCQNAQNLCVPIIEMSFVLVFPRFNVVVYCSLWRKMHI